MVSLQFKPTRMELSNLKKRQKVAVRGHKMMKDKRDEMVRRFIVYVRRNKTLRDQVEQRLADAMRTFVLARASMGDAALEEALLVPSRTIHTDATVEYVLSIPVPKLTMQLPKDAPCPYGFLSTAAELDGAVQALCELLPMLLELAAVEKTCNRLADEIEKTRRRANALEYVMIPQLTDAIHRIKMKLEENERGNLTRLMKTKEMLEGKQDTTAQ